MINKINIKRFKSLKDISLELNQINVFVGTNNAGKSSILQAIQFATSIAQTAKAYYPSNAFSRKGTGSVTIAPEQLIYSPLKDPYSLAHNETLKESIDKCIYVSFYDNDARFLNLSITKGRNKNLVAKFVGESLGKEIVSLEKPVCMYVPGLAGIPFSEEIRSVGAVRRIAAKGDSNTVFRNILSLLRDKREKWNSFLEDLRYIFPNISLEIINHKDTDGSIDVNFKLPPNEINEPIDLAGTGILQAIQIAAYVNYFSPQILLLDEPDSHLHPDNQRLLAQLLIKLSQKSDLTVLLTTHSRHLMCALQHEAKFFLVKNGDVSSAKYSHYGALMDIGAIDDYDRIINGDIKYIVLSEDGTLDARNHLKLVMQASGWDETKFIIYPFNGVSKLESAIIASNFLVSLNPELKVIIYRDRDGLYDEEFEKIKEKCFRDNPNVHRIIPIISKYNDIESYFCTSEHLRNICTSLELEEARTMVQAAMQQIKSDSLGKFMAHKAEIAKMLRLDSGSTLRDAPAQYDLNEFVYVHGKSLRGVIAQKLQEKFHSNIDLFKHSEHLKDERFTSILSEASAGESNMGEDDGNRN